MDVPPAAWARYQELLAARAAGHPVHYLVGEREFMGLSFAVDPRVMIPRPETEVLVEYLLDFVRDHPAPTLVDVGTGSACIAVSLAVGAPQARIFAIDISPQALEVARANALRHHVEDRITFLEGDLLSPLPRHLRHQIDAIVSNPPYIPQADAGQLPKEIRDHEPSLALFAPSAGTEVHARLIADGPRWLGTGKVLAMEVGLGQAALVAAAIRQEGHYGDVHIRKDLAGIDRVVAGVVSEQRDAPR